MADEAGPTNGRATIREVYELGQRIEAKVDALAERTDRRIDAMARSNEQRFDALERWQITVKTAGSVAKSVWLILVSIGASVSAALIVASLAS